MTVADSGGDQLSEWTVYGSRTIYTSPWVELDLVDVEPPGLARYEHHLVKWAPVASVVLLNDRDEVLLMWRHRFTTRTWNWEIPAGIVEPGEEVAVAAAREVLEETGYRVDPARLEPPSTTSSSPATGSGSPNRPTPTRRTASSGIPWPTSRT